MGKKKKYLEACLQQLRYFSSFSVSVDRLMGVEAEAALRRISSLLATKYQQIYSNTCGYIKIIIMITLVRATHWYIQGSMVTAHRISMKLLQWDD